MEEHQQDEIVAREIYLLLDAAISVRFGDIDTALLISDKHALHHRMLANDAVRKGAGPCTKDATSKRKTNGIHPTPQVRRLPNANANYNVDPAWYRVMPIRCLMCYIYLDQHTLISYTRCHRST
jgi:hypothetical protein